MHLLPMRQDVTVSTSTGYALCSSSKTCSGCGHKQDMPLWKRTYRCPNPNCCLVMDRDENSAVNILKRYLARLGPHTERISVRCADVFTAIKDVLNTFEHI